MESLLQSFQRWCAGDFHKHCDNKGPTVVLVKANDCIFGGYTDQNWEGMKDMMNTLIFVSFYENYIYIILQTCLFKT